MKAKPRKKKLYLVRFFNRQSAYLYRLYKRPERIFGGDGPFGSGELAESEYITRLCGKELKRICGFSLREGEVREVKSIKFTFAK